MITSERKVYVFKIVGQQTQIDIPMLVDSYVTDSAPYVVCLLYFINNLCVNN